MKGRLSSILAIASPPMHASRRRDEPVGTGGCGSSAAARLATLPVSNSPKQVAPDPDMRANAAPGLVQRRAARLPMAGASACAGGLQIVAGDLQPVADGCGSRGCAGSGGSAVIVAPTPAPRTHRASQTATPGLTSTSASAGKSATSSMLVADAARDQRPRRKAHRHVGAETERRAAPDRRVGVVQLPESRQPAQRRRRVARPAADAGGNRQVLFEPDRDRRAGCSGNGCRAARRAPPAPDCRRRAGTASAKRPGDGESDRVGAGSTATRSPKRVKTARLSSR